MAVPTRKICLIGDTGLGKTMAVRYLEGEPEATTFSTIGTEVHPLRFYEDPPVGEVVADVWDCAGQEKFGGLRQGYYIKAVGAVRFFRGSAAEQINWIQEFLSQRPEQLVVDVQVDAPDGTLLPKSVVAAKLRAALLVFF